MPFGTSRVALDARLNLTVTEDYVSEWGLWEGVRELYQNFKDAVVASARADNLPIESVGRAGPHQSAASFSMQLCRDSYPRTVYGTISFEAGCLTLSNRGHMSKQCLLLGGSDAEKYKQQDAEVAGRFGEGAPRALCACFHFLPRQV